MSDPVLDEELDAEALAMLAAFRADERPAQGVRKRVWSRLQEEPAVVRPATASAVGNLKWVGVGVAMAAGLVLAIAGLRGSLFEEDAVSRTRPEAALQHEGIESGGEAEIKHATPRNPVTPRPTPAVAPPEDSGAPEPTPDAAPTEPTAEDTAKTARPRRPKRDGGDEPDLTGTLAQETKLLKQARAALAAGNPTRCLASLETHAHKFPSGVLAEERDALRAVALCTAGRQTEGERAAKAFAARHPASPLLGRVRGACRQP